MRILLLVTLLLAACGQPPRPTVGYIPGPVERDAVRVALQVAVEEVAFAAPEGAVWRTAETEGRLPVGSASLRERAGQVELATDAGWTPIGAGPVRFAANGLWSVGGDRFAGDLVVQRATWGGLTLVNLVEIEDYLRGVVPWEIGRPGWDALEAVKAQAIAARTYTIRHLGRWEELGFDVYSDVRDQVYRGRTGTAEITDRAVKETRDEVLVFGDELARAYYSSTCGGHTSTLTDVWDREGAPYLTGFRDVDSKGRSWCGQSPHFRWTEVWSARELGSVLRTYLGDEIEQELGPTEFGVLRGIEAVQRDPSGRVTRLRIRTDRSEYEVWGDRIRWVLRPVHSRFTILRSTMFEIELQEAGGALGRVILRGGGFGHGVGLCQTGALGRARAGQRAEKILEAYYPGSKVDRRGANPGPS